MWHVGCVGCGVCGRLWVLHAWTLVFAYAGVNASCTGRWGEQPLADMYILKKNAEDASVAIDFCVTGRCDRMMHAGPRPVVCGDAGACRPRADRPHTLVRFFPLVPPPPQRSWWPGSP
jgi:hypothetical protein